MVKVPFGRGLDAGRQWLAENALSQPQIEVLSHIYDLSKAYWRDMRRTQNADELAAPAIALMKRQGSALAAAFAVPVAPTIETLSASPPAYKQLT